MLLLSALKAREATNEIVGNCLTEELEMITTKINKAIIDGKYETYIDKNILAGAKCKLINFGYTVHQSSQYNETYTLIQW